MSDVPKEQAWLLSGSEWPEYEDYLIGSKRGFEMLRRAIDEAGETGESRIAAEGDIVGIKILSDDPRLANTGAKRGIRDAAALVVFAFVLFCIAMIFFAGLFQIWSWMR